ncbi:TetR/AcrR family transcriptional regulator [Nocardioides sp. MH1]|uniref:TetR/AcrR family transcriptional regulator n=1 Tax=Nocardioides sp. MH1 TaxID=3242490 RepID=UPI003522C7BD
MSATSDTAAPRTRGRPGYDRETVLRRAIELFNRHGYDATSVGDIAADLGITKSAIYHHFASKESMLSAALDEALEELNRLVDATAATQAATAYDRLRATVEGAVRILASHLPAVTLLLRVRGNSEIEQRALVRRRHIDEQLASLVRQAADEGALRTDVDPELISRLVFGMVNSLVEWYHPDGSVDPAALSERVADVVFEGLRSS